MQHAHGRGNSTTWGVRLPYPGNTDVAEVPSFGPSQSWKDLGRFEA